MTLSVTRGFRLADAPSGEGMGLLSRAATERVLAGLLTLAELASQLFVPRVEASLVANWHIGASGGWVALTLRWRCTRECTVLTENCQQKTVNKVYRTKY